MEDDELTNTDLESNKVVYVSSNQLGEGMSPIKVEDESEDVLTPGTKLNNRKITVGLDSRRSNDQSSYPACERATSNKKASISNTRKPPAFAA